MIKNKLILFLKDGFVSKSLKVLFLRVGGVILFFSLTLFLTNNFPTEEVGKYDFTRSLLLILGGLCLLCTELLSVVPLKYISSYIGVTPQALSRIRKRINWFRFIVW